MSIAFYENDKVYKKHEITQKKAVAVATALI